MQYRRMTRRTNAFSKKWDNHRYAMALHFSTYNFIRPKGTLTKDAEGYDVLFFFLFNANLADIV